jgi:type II secretion system protein C
MKKYCYIILGAVGAALLIALIILSYVDRTVLSPSKTARDVSATKSAGGPVGSMAGQPVPADDKSATSRRGGISEEGGSITSPSLNLRLIGVTVFGEKSTAILEDTIKGTSGVYRLKDIVRGFTIAAIDRDSVTLTAGGRFHVLTLSPGTGQSDADSFFTKLDDNSWLVSSEKATDMVSHIDQYAGQVIAFQHRENGEAAGFKIRHLQEGNDFEKLGLKNNDIIKRVNGLEVNDLTDVLQAVYQLSDETEFTLEVQRGDGMQDLNYRLDKNVNALVPIISRMLNIPLSAVGIQ